MKFYHNIKKDTHAIVLEGQAELEVMEVILRRSDWESHADISEALKKALGQIICDLWGEISDHACPSTEAWRLLEGALYFSLKDK